MATSNNTATLGQWIMNTQTTGLTNIPTNTKMYVTNTNQALQIINTTSSSNIQNANSTRTIKTYDDWGSIISGFSNREMLDALRGGVALSDGSRLKLVGDKPVIEHRHTEGCEKLRPVPVSHYGTIDFSDSEHVLGPDAILKLPDGTYLKTDSDGNMIVESFKNAHRHIVDVSGDALCLYESLAFCHFGDIHIPDGARTNAVFTLPNGVKIKLNPDDSVEIDESDMRRLYRAPETRNFNKFLNASDLLEEFIKYCAEQKVTRKDFAELPVSLFIYWLIVRAAEADGDPTDDSTPLLIGAVKDQRHQPSRCKCCGRFIAKKLTDNGINFCSSDHMQKHMERIT